MASPRQRRSRPRSLRGQRSVRKQRRRSSRRSAPMRRSRTRRYRAFDPMSAEEMDQLSASAREDVVQNQRQVRAEAAAELRKRVQEERGLQKERPSAAATAAQRRAMGHNKILIFGCGPAAWTLALICRLRGFTVHMWCPNKDDVRRYIMLCQPNKINEMSGKDNDWSTQVVELLTTLSKKHPKHAATHLPPLIQGFHKRSTTDEEHAPFSVTWTTLRDHLKDQTYNVRMTGSLVELTREPVIRSESYSYVVSADGSSRQVARRMGRHNAQPLTFDDVYGMTIVYTSTNQDVEGSDHVKDPFEHAQRSYRLFADGDNRYIGLRVADVQSKTNYLEYFYDHAQMMAVYEKVTSTPFTKQNIAMSKFYNFADTLERVPGDEAFNVTLDEADEGRVVYSQVYRNEYNADMQNKAAALIVHLHDAMDSLNEADRAELINRIDADQVEISPIFKLQLTAEEVGPVVEDEKMYQIGDALLQWDFFGGMGVNAAIASAIVLGTNIGDDACDQIMRNHYDDLRTFWERNSIGLGRRITSLPSE